MKTNQIAALAFYCLLFLSNCISFKENQDGDILALLIENPKQLEFVECKTGSEQIILEATYKVSGENAHLIENLLTEETGMNRLRYVCSGWEAHPDGALKITDRFNHKYNNIYNYNHISISMYSRETLVRDRKDWSKIPYFYIVVEVLNI
ncbi:DUF4952 domain-containing protein [Marispirochaeta sp.]|uniref:DUF4952 domain-containing protein n=1 Tax=Marispirochaeta sp. TaxID=2038653 RepID=UPI0029C6F749|nr:DUF4952 domain-containing protein [Marispirochaeta sp.]